MENLSDVIEAAKGIGKSQKSIVESLFEVKSSLPIRFFSSKGISVFKLQDKGIIKIEKDHISLTELGQDVYDLYKGKYDEEINVLNQIERKKLSRSAEIQQKKCEKSNQFLELYKQGLSYQDIGDKYGISRERVRQILNPNVEFRKYTKEREEARLAAEEQAEQNKLVAEEQKKVQAKEKLHLKSLAALYPERVAELWDYEKNGDLKPEEVLAGSGQQYIWFKCSERHSWSKKPNQIASSWRRSRTSGCPMCAGRKKKAERQPSLTDVYSEMMGEYWDYEKN